MLNISSGAAGEYVVASSSGRSCKTQNQKCFIESALISIVADDPACLGQPSVMWTMAGYILGCLSNGAGGVMTQDLAVMQQGMMSDSFTVCEVATL
jgi:hypothetical protein